MACGVLPNQKGDTIIVGEEATFVREFSNFAERRWRVSLGRAEETGRKDRWSPDVDVTNGSFTGRLILLFTMPIGMREASHSRVKIQLGRRHNRSVGQRGRSSHRRRWLRGRRKRGRHDRRWCCQRGGRRNRLVRR